MIKTSLNHISGSGQSYDLHTLVQQYISVSAKVKIIETDISVEYNERCEVIMSGRKADEFATITK